MESPRPRDDKLPVTDIADDLPAAQDVGVCVLKNVVAYVEVRAPHDNRSEGVRVKLEELGATVVKKFTKDVTHVIFRGGSERTRKKALKTGVHFVSVLWVENCLQNQEHVSERLYPAVNPSSSTPLFLTKMKRTKSMQPLDFEVELANSAERLKRKRKREEKVQSCLLSSDHTPSSSPLVLVQDTQPRSPGDGFYLTPVRLTIPDTPPSMRERLEQLRRARQESSLNTEEDEAEIEAEVNRQCMDQFKKTLFNGDDLETSSLGVSPIQKADINETLSPRCNINNTIETDSQADVSDNLSLSQDVNKEIFNIVHNITSSLNKIGSRFDSDSDVNLLSSQEIGNLVKDKKAPSDKLITTPPVKKLTFPESTEKVVEKISEVVRETVTRKSVKNKLEKTRRTSRRLSINQVVQDIAGSNVEPDVTLDKNKMCERDEDENPLPSIDGLRKQDNGVNDKLKKNTKVTQNESLNTSSGKSKTQARRKSIHVSQVDSQESDANVKPKNNRRKSAVGRLTQDTTEKKNVPVCTDEILEVQVGTSVNQTAAITAAKARRGKKKLLSVADELNSVLLEPTVSSNIERPEIIEQNPKKGKKKGKTKMLTSSIETSADKIVDGEVVAKKRQNNKAKNINKIKEGDNTSLDGTQNTQIDNCSKSKGDNDIDKTPVEKKRRTKSVSNTKSKKTSQTRLVDDIHIESVDKSVTSSQLSNQPCESNTTNRDLSDIGELTTQLDLTKDSTMLPSVRNNSMSLSMSAAYNDSNMPSFLSTTRKSIDEFNTSKRGRKRQKIVSQRSVLGPLHEGNVTSHSSSSESDGSVRGMQGVPRLDVSAARINMRPSLVMTSLHSHEQDVVISIVKKLGGFVLSESVNEATTHVVCGAPRRTLNILQGIVRGIWLIKKDWVIKSLEAGHWIPETDFECWNMFPACKVSRVERQQFSQQGGMVYRQDLFSSEGPVYVSGRAVPPRPQLVQLIKMCGGQVTGQLAKTRLYVGSDYHLGLTCVKPTWILDSIMSHKALPKDRYLLDQPKRESSPVY